MSGRGGCLIAGALAALVTLACLQQISCRKAKLKDVSLREGAPKDL